MLDVFLQRIVVVLLALILDRIIGDPVCRLHPVRLMGSLITVLERLLRQVFRSERALYFAGFLLVVFSIAISVCVFQLLMYVVRGFPYLRFFVDILLCTTCLAARSLADEVRKTIRALTVNIEQGRKQVAMIVGRDTQELNESEILKACIETTAENASDGVIAPLLYMIFFGSLGGIIYKHINTLDSMVGYKNKKYAQFGFVAAKLDDLANLIPSRLTALAFFVRAYIHRNKFSRQDCRRAWLIFKRDRYNHTSPNSAQTESMVSGLLGVQLGGAHHYFGNLVVKPTIGDAVKEPSPDDVEKTIHLMLDAEIFVFIVAFLVKLLLIGCVYMLIG